MPRLPFLLAALLLAPSAIAQDGAAPAAPAAAEAESAPAATSIRVPGPSAALVGALRTARTRQVVSLAPMPGSVALPFGWDGPVEVNDAHRNHAVVTLTNTAPGHPLYGATIRVERVVGFQGVERQRWLRGQTPYRYHRAGPVGPTTLPGHSYAVELGGNGIGGAVVFIPQGAALYAISVEAPAALWAARRDAVAGLIRAVRAP